MTEEPAREYRETWFFRLMAKNVYRIRLLFGLLYLALFAWALAISSYPEAVVAGVVGWLYLGGWRALYRTVRAPRWQVKHWLNILVDAREESWRRYGDGSIKHIEMKPTMHGWREVRR